MRAELSKLSIEGTTLELPPRQANGVSYPARSAHVRSAEGLRGTLITGQGFKLEGLAATAIELAALDWHFGKVFLATRGGAKMGGLRAHIESQDDDVDLDLELASVQAERLSLRVGELEIEGRLDALALTLAVHGEDVGYLRAEQALLHDFSLRTGALELALPELRVRNLLVDWGGERFRLEAETAEGATMKVVQDGNEVRANDVALSAFELHGERVRLGAARFARLEVMAALGSRSERKSVPAATAPALQKPALFDYALLDGLEGHVNVDLFVDVRVPIIGHRRATHELRVRIEDGAIDYRDLESNLARLEDSLIDFSVRDDALMLEVGLPLIPTRGRGKPILRWDLSPEDLELAKNRRVRLSVLPSVRSASSSSEPPREAEDDKDGKTVRLRTLSAQNLDAALRLTAADGPLPAALRSLSFESLQLSGTVHHDADDAARAGTLRGTLEALRLQLSDLPLGASRLDGRLALSRLENLELHFSGLQLTRAKAALENLTIDELSLGS